MGIHYTDARLAEDRRTQQYFRADADGRLDTDADRPSLFGRGFDGPMEGHTVHCP
jgi:hypothetical protein